MGFRRPRSLRWVFEEVEIGSDAQRKCGNGGDFNGFQWISGDAPAFCLLSACLRYFGRVAAPARFGDLITQARAACWGARRAMFHSCFGLFSCFFMQKRLILETKQGVESCFRSILGHFEAMKRRSSRPQSQGVWPRASRGLARQLATQTR